MKKSGIVLLISFSLFSCGRFSKKELDTKKDIRIVSVSKHLTEMLFALGKGHDIVACDLTSSYPDSAKLLPTVGYHRALNPEGIVSMKPDIIIHSNDIGPASVLPQLEKLQLNIKAFNGANTLDSAKLLLTDLGKFFGAEKQSDSLNALLDADMKLVAIEQAKIKDTPTVMIIHYGQANNVYFVMSGRKGPGDKMIVSAIGKTANYDAKGAKQISAEAIAKANPDIIIATDYGFDKMGSAEKFKSVPGVSLTNAAKNNKIYRFEEHDLVYFGPRSGQNILKLIKLLHPILSADAKK
ncbi:MAG: ABC transporter substrate-binding protein [Sediminibacterium sp.]|jgi:iron complex transport system substrate-binding protein